MATTAKILQTSNADRIAAREAGAGARVRVWDAPVRLFHWIVVVLVGTSWVTAEDHLLTVHLWSGVALLTLVIFRVAWGFLGSTTARFSNFVAPPRSVFGYVRALMRGDKPLYAGHNPAGGWMVIALLAMLTIQAVIGLFANDDIHFNAPLSMLISRDASDSLTDLHGRLFNLVLLLVWIHVVAVFFYRFVKGEDLLVPMLTGTKPATSVPAGVALKFGRYYLALFLFFAAIAAVAAVWWLVQP
jgi:cytochrome b